MPVPAVAFEHVTKRFPGALALEDVSFEVAAGSCHALCGENGAGKSTLGRVLGGIYAPDSGRVTLFGEPLDLSGPQDALASGIGVVHQELAFCENLSVAENLCLRSIPARGGFVAGEQMRRRAEEMLAGIGAMFDVRRLVGALTIGQRQMLQIAAAVSHGARVIVFDEPTSSLSQHEAERLYELIGRIRAKGVTCLYITHRMEELFRLCDEVTVLRDGRHVTTQPAAALNTATLVQLMIGRPLAEYFPAAEPAHAGEEVLRVEGLSSASGFEGVSLSLHAGEVLGMAGLVGAGRSEVALALFGLDRLATGRIWVRGQLARLRTPRDAMRLGIGLVPEDRKRQGLVLSMSAVDNTTLAILETLARLTIIRRQSERAVAREYFNRLDVRTPGLDAATAGLSGGNQQKVVLAKWLAARCRILILDEPTRGVDVGAKAQIHALIAELAAGGAGVLLISSELPEILHLSSRILVLRQGRIAGELPRARATQDGLMHLMAGTAA
jgi:ABC-type sugar transport system ATPase subunit